MEPCSCMQCMTGRREGVLTRYILYIIYMWIWLHVNIVASGMWKFDGIIVLLCSYPSQLRTHICSSLTKKVALSALWMLIHSQGAPCSSRLRHPAIYDIFAWGKCECTRRVMTSIHMWGRGGRLFGWGWSWPTNHIIWQTDIHSQLKRYNVQNNKKREEKGKKIRTATAKYI